MARKDLTLADVGVELTSMGALYPPKGGQEFAHKQKDKYRKLVVDADNRAVGCIVLGMPEFASKLSALVAANTQLTKEQTNSLKDKIWQCF